MPKNHHDIMKGSCGCRKTKANVEAESQVNNDTGKGYEDGLEWPYCGALN